MRLLYALPGLAALCVASPTLACASCGCTLTADWLSQGLVAQPGTTIGLRYDYIPQTQLRTETRTVTDAEKATPSDRELERYTYNHYATATFDRQFDADWGANVQVPFVYRPHQTISPGDTDASYARTQGLGDVRITARWQGFKLPGCISGLQVGLVLPTGRFHETFRSGPSAGSEVDRGLQPGFGVVQAVVGGYVYGKLAKNFDYILQAQAQIPLDHRDLYKPGAVGQVSAGVHYTRLKAVIPQLELSFRAAARDTGINSDRPNSAGEQLYVAPGVIVPIKGGLSIFGYVQLPVYERLNGFQLAPKATLTVGAQMRL